DQKMQQGGAESGPGQGGAGDSPAAGDWPFQQKENQRACPGKVGPVGRSCQDRFYTEPPCWLRGGRLRQDKDLWPSAVPARGLVLGGPRHANPAAWRRMIRGQKPA